MSGCFFFHGFTSQDPQAPGDFGFAPEPDGREPMDVYIYIYGFTLHNQVVLIDVFFNSREGTHVQVVVIQLEGLIAILEGSTSKKHIS